jgi:hypothetical protein
MIEAILIHFRKDIVAVAATALELLSLPFIDCFRDLIRGGSPQELGKCNISSVTYGQ